MPDDPTFTKLFGPPKPSSELDVDLVLRRARRRRLPKQLAAGGILTLAIGGIAVASVQGLAAPSSQSSVALDTSTVESDLADGGADTEAFSSEDSTPIDPTSADRINLCGGPLAEVAPSDTGLTVETNFDDADASASEVLGTVTLTNTGDSAVSGTSGTWVAITLSQDGIVKWHTNGAHTDLGRDIELGPGESIDYEARFVPVTCGVDDDLAEGFPAELPALPAGDYQVSAALDLVIGGEAELVTGPRETVTLR